MIIKFITKILSHYPKELASIKEQLEKYIKKNPNHQIEETKYSPAISTEKSLIHILL